jgi:hypothetical protein
MKKNLVISSVIALLCAGSSFAQSEHGLKAEVPFNFSVGSTKMPAGTYAIDLQRHPGVVLMQKEECCAAVNVIGAGISAKKGVETPKLVFNRYGSEYFLTQVWDIGNSGRAIVKSAREKELAKAKITHGEETLYAKRR